MLLGLETFTSVYLDDMIVFSKTVEEHKQHLRQVLGRLNEAGLNLNARKCQFLKEEVSFLGYVVSAEGLSTDPEKVEAIWKYPVPTNLSERRAFLGLASYYRHFVNDFAKLAYPLHGLLKKDVQFSWTQSSSGLSASFSRVSQRLLY